MPTDRRWTGADRELVARTIHDHACPSDQDAGCNWTEDGTECRLTEFMGFADAVLDAVLPDHDARIRASVAADIQAHADRHAPAGYPLNHPRTVLRRHLLLAARIAEGPLTDADLADIAAQVVGLARAHATTEGDPNA